MVIGERIKIFF